MDIEELRTQLASERLAREQGDDRCMENIRDLVTEEREVREVGQGGGKAARRER